MANHPAERMDLRVLSRIGLWLTLFMLTSHVIQPVYSQTTPPSSSTSCRGGFFFDVTLSLCLPCDPLCLGAGQRHRGCEVCFAPSTAAPASPTVESAPVATTSQAQPTNSDDSIETLTTSPIAEQVTTTTTTTTTTSISKVVSASPSAVDCKGTACTSPVADSNASSPASNSFMVDTPVIVAAAISAILVIIIIVLLAVFMHQHRRKREARYGSKTVSALNQPPPASARPKSNDYAHLWTSEQSPQPERRPISGQYSVPRPLALSDAFSRPSAPTPRGQKPQQQPTYPPPIPPTVANHQWLRVSCSQPSSKTSTLESEIVEMPDVEAGIATQHGGLGPSAGLAFHRMRSVSAENLPQLVSENHRRRQNWLEMERRANPNPRQASSLARQLSRPSGAAPPRDQVPTQPMMITAAGTALGAAQLSSVVVRSTQPNGRCTVPVRPWSMTNAVDTERPLSDTNESCRSTGTNSSACTYSTSSSCSRGVPQQLQRASTGASLTPTALRNSYGETGYDSFTDEYYDDDQLA